METIRFTGRGVHHVLRRRANRLGLASHLVATHHVAVLRLGINDARVTQVGNGDETVAAQNLEPVIIENAATHPRGAGSTPVVVVLHAAAHVVRRFHVKAHMVKQAHGHVLDELPRTRHIVRRRQTAIVTDDHMIGILRINPDAVHVVVRHERRVGFKGATAIHGEVQPHASHIDALRIHRINAQLTEIHRSRIRVALLGPRGAAVGGLVQPRDASHHATSRWRRRCRVHVLRCRRSPLRRWRRTFNGGIHNVRAVTEHVHGNASKRARREAGARHLGPRLATIGGLPQRTAGAATVHATRRATTLIRGGKQNVRIGRRHHELISARFVVHLEHLLPAFATVGGFVHPTLTTRAEQWPSGRHQHHIVVGRMHHDAIDVLGLRQSHQRKRVAAVGGLINAAAPRRALPVIRFTGAHPHQIGVDLRYRNIPDRNEPLILKERRE